MVFLNVIKPSNLFSKPLKSIVETVYDWFLYFSFMNIVQFFVEGVYGLDTINKLLSYTLKFQVPILRIFVRL